MKKTIISIISVVVLLSILAGAIFAFTLQEDKEAVEQDTYEVLASAINSNNGASVLTGLNQREIFSDFSEANISKIMSAFDLIIEQNDVVELARVPLTCIMFENNDIAYQVNGNRIVVETDVDNNLLKYAMYASVYVINFPEAVHNPNDPRLMRNAAVSPNIVVSFDYDKYGYDNAFEYVTSDAEIGENTYEFWYNSVDLFRVKDDTILDPAPNLLSCICSGDSIRIQRCKGTYVPEVDYTEEDLAVE